MNVQSEQADLPMDNVRPAYCAGQWYPGEARRLAGQIDAWFDSAEAPHVEGRPLAVIAPHAGYVYSGPTAAAGYAPLRGHRYRRTIVLAFSHRYASTYRGVNVPAALDAYDTPLGAVPIDREAVAALQGKPGITSAPDIDSGEHSLELQLPFLQRAIGDFRLVPMLVGRMTVTDHAKIAATLLPLVDRNTLIVASTDFTHFGAHFDYRPFRTDVEAGLTQLAANAAAAIERADFDGFIEHLRKTDDTICGREPVALLLRILSMRAGAMGVRTAFEMSGRMTGDFGTSVTYQSFVFVRRPLSLPKDDRERLLRLARRTVEAAVGERPAPEPDPDELTETTQTPGACFVTLKNHGMLRGCIGNMQAAGPLFRAVIDNAVAAATRDYRFAGNPVTPEELDDLDIEISYLTPMRRAEDVKEIVVGRHGLYVSQGLLRGVLLPQVAYERGWTREEFLAQTCVKAGLPPGAWKDAASEIHTFEAEVFDERDAD